MSIQWTPLLPIWLTLVLAALLFGSVVFGMIVLMRKQGARKLTITLSCVRFAIALMFLLILLQPAITHTSSVPVLPEMIVLLDTSASMGEMGSKGSRLGEVSAALQQGDFAATLKERYHLQWFAFDGSVRPLNERDLGSLKPGASAARIAESIDAAVLHARALGKNPQRLLLASAGHDRGQADPVEAAQRSGLNVDVLPPTDAKPGPAPAIAIAEVQGQRRVLLGSDTLFRVRIDGKRPASTDRPGTLRVTEDGKKILDQRVVLKAGRVEHALDLSFRPSAVGLKQYGFHLIDTGAKPYPVAVQVLDNKYEVLILEDRWRWEYKYLHRLFEDDPSFRFSALLHRSGGAFVQFGSPDRRVNLLGFPQSRADLEGFDTFVLGDVDTSKWPRGLASELARLVAEDGRSLVVVAGPGLVNLMEVADLHAILPVELTAESSKPIEGPIDVRLRGDGSSSPFFFQVRSQDAEQLTPLDQIYPVLRKRAGATVLLEAAKERNTYGNRIVIAEHTVGRGRVLFVGTDTLWKWHTLAANQEGPTPYSIFWQQAFRAMTPARSNTGAVNLWLTPQRSRTGVGAAVAVTAEVQANSTRAQPTIDGFVTFSDDKRLPLLFSSDAVNPRFYRAEFAATQPGVVRISASLKADGKVLAESATSVHADERDSADLGIDMATLAHIAQDTGGNVIDPERPDTWPAPGESLPPVERVRTVDLWSNFSLLLALCVLLGIDWFVRLFKGLVSG